MKKVILDLQQKAWQQLTYRFGLAKRRSTAWLNKNTRHFSTLHWKIILALFASAWSLASSYCFYSAFHQQKTPAVKIEPLPPPLLTARDTLYWLERIYQQKNK